MLSAGRRTDALLKAFLARDRAQFLLPALAAAAFNPLPWLLHLGPDPKGPFAGFGGWAALELLGPLLLVGGIPALLGWAFASRSVFGVLAWGGAICWIWWASLLAGLHWIVTVAWPGLSMEDRAIATLLAAQLLGYPLAFWLALRAGMAWDRRPSPGAGGND